MGVVLPPRKRQRDDGRIYFLMVLLNTYRRSNLSVSPVNNLYNTCRILSTWYLVLGTFYFISFYFIFIFLFPLISLVISVISLSNIKIYLSSWFCDHIACIYYQVNGRKNRLGHFLCVCSSERTVQCGLMLLSSH